MVTPFELCTTSMRTSAGLLRRAVFDAVTSTSPEDEAEALIAPLTPLISITWPVERRPCHWKSLCAIAGTAVANTTPAISHVVEFNRIRLLRIRAVGLRREAASKR